MVRAFLEHILQLLGKKAGVPEGFVHPGRTHSGRTVWHPGWFDSMGDGVRQRHQWGVSLHIGRDRLCILRGRYLSCDDATRRHGQNSDRTCCASWLPTRPPALPLEQGTHKQTGTLGRRKPSTRCNGFRMALTGSVPIVARGFRQRAFRLSLKLRDASPVKPNTNGARPAVQKRGVSPGDRPDGTRWTRGTQR